MPSQFLCILSLRSFRFCYMFCLGIHINFEMKQLDRNCLLYLWPTLPRYLLAICILWFGQRVKVICKWEEKLLKKQRKAEELLKKEKSSGWEVVANQIFWSNERESEYMAFYFIYFPPLYINQSQKGNKLMFQLTSFIP